MPDRHPAAFALKKSGLDAFLYADVGNESNGSALTILSVLARLGMDPWSQAARWAALSTDGAIDGLSQSISQMPLTPAVLAESRAIATRLVQLLPGKTSPAASAKACASAPAATVPNWSTGTMIWYGLAIWIAVSALIAPKILPDVVAPLNQQTVLPGATAAAHPALEHHAAVVPPVLPLLR